MPDDSFDRKASGENKIAIWKTCNWRKILEASNKKYSFRSVATAVRESAVCLR